MGFKEGDIYVRIGVASNAEVPLKNVGDITICIKDDKTSFYYKGSTCTNKNKVRPATPQEIVAYNNGITNIKDIPTEVGLEFEIY